ncbi:inositol monophosphatase family protein [Thiolinea disciformis]|uniref:inositol monophosphatase family protein n=1 Tax=Thiolinea disciformis TaxID=125614 RepID=UPI00037EFB0C|nr:inositol monophosphatase family protein [Thiolinea disciformis]
MHPMLNIATRTARQAGEMIRRYAGEVDKLRIHHKADNDFVTEVDRQVEREIVFALKRAYPDHAILGEEGSTHGSDDAEYQWVIDPLDGTTNFLYGLQHFSVSIGLKQKGRPFLGVVFDPVRDEMFAAVRGEGATLNNRKLRVSARPGLQNALLATGVPFRTNQNLDLYLDTMRALLPSTAGVRRMGSAALDLAYVACGRFDGFWEFGLKEWDMAAGIVLVQEAGGLTTDLQGGNNHWNTGDILAGSPKVYKEMLQRLHPIMNRTS